MSTSRRRLAVQSVPVYILAVLIVMGMTLTGWMLRGTLTLANFISLYLLGVLIIATRQGTGPALVASVMSFLGINFFLVHPYYTFLVADPREILDLIVFLLVAVLVGQLASNIRQQTQKAQQRAKEQEILYNPVSYTHLTLPTTPYV